MASRQVRVWVHPKKIQQIHENGYPDSYSTTEQEGLVEMTISSEEFLQWQMKKTNPVQERALTGKQILCD